MPAEDTKKAINQSNKIVKGIDKISKEIEKLSKKLKNKSINKTISLNNTKTPFKATSLVESSIDSDLQKIINDTESDFNDFLEETERYLSNNFAIKLSQKDLRSIASKESIIIDSLIDNTEILKRDIKSLLTQNLSKGVPEKQLVTELKELYPAYERNASTLINTGLARTFVDINVTKFRQSRFNWYIWAGPNDSITRETPCKHWVWHRFPASQLNFITGIRLQLWNCRHNIIPIPDEEIGEYPIGNLKDAQ